MSQIHANCILIGAYAILLRGPSGSGKSSLSLRLMSSGAVLISDDRTDLYARDGRLIASCPPQIAGLFEVRGIGVVRGFPTKAEGDVRLIVDLVDELGDIDRMPNPESEQICGIEIPKWKFCVSDLAVEAKIGVALALATGQMQLEP
ncbi:HPr kinase/phosphorylase [Thalassospira lucentensis]|uniref:HPr kinase/phosphorylase n=1 Tax=Thalassospira lucentensis TaxID=168935 RepID=UPI003AA99073